MMNCTSATLSASPPVPAPSTAPVSLRELDLTACSPVAIAPGPSRGAWLTRTARLLGATLGLVVTSALHAAADRADALGSGLVADGRRP